MPLTVIICYFDKVVFTLSGFSICFFPMCFYHLPVLALPPASELQGERKRSKIWNHVLLNFSEFPTVLFSEDSSSETKIKLLTLITPFHQQCEVQSCQVWVPTSEPGWGHRHGDPMHGPVCAIARSFKPWMLLNGSVLATLVVLACICKIRVQPGEPFIKNMSLEHLAHELQLFPFDLVLFLPTEKE